MAQRVVWSPVTGCNGYFVRWTTKDAYDRWVADPAQDPGWTVRQFGKNDTLARFSELGVFAERDGVNTGDGHYIDPITGSRIPISGNYAKSSTLVFQVAAIGPKDIAGVYSPPIFYESNIAPPATVTIEE